MLVCKKCSTVIVNAQPIVHYSVCIKCRKQEADKFNGSDTISIKDINKQIAKEMKDATDKISAASVGIRDKDLK